MSREKRHRKKKHDKDKNDENDNHRSKDRLFTEADGRAADIPYYTMNNYPVSQANPTGEERRIPLGVVEIDKSVKLPSPTRKSPHTLKSHENHSREDVHLPAITHHQPYEYYDPSNPAHHVGYFSHPSPIYEQYRVPHDHHHHHHDNDHGHDHHHHRHHHRRHRHRHHHRHEQEVETYDRRWWYMPAGSVHRPESKKVVEYHYVAPKWYHSSTAQSRMSFISQEVKIPSARKYVDCRCGVCRPWKEIPRGVRWIVNE